MRRDLAGAARGLAVPTAAVLAITFVAPGRLEVALRIYALILCATAIVVVLLALRRAYPDEHVLRDPLPRVARRVPPPGLVRLEHETALAIASSFDVHYRLVPRLRALASGLLSARRNVSLAQAPETARTILGEEVWELVRPDRPAPEDRLGKGIGLRALGRVTDALEGF